METMTIEVKRGNKYQESCQYTEVLNRDYIHERLANDLLHHYVHKARYITRISDRSNYDGTRTVTVNYDNDTRAVYVINNR